MVVPNNENDVLDDNIHPIECVNTIKTLTMVTLALGIQRTRTELIPFFTETVDVNMTEEDILVDIAEQLCMFTPLVGGPEHAYYLYPPLENLATLENITVRDTAIESLKTIMSEQSSMDVEEHFIPVLQRLLSNDLYIARISGCQLISTCYAKVSSAAKATLRDRFRTLSQDEVQAVRLSATSHLNEFAIVIEPEYVKSYIVPIFQTLVRDQEKSVRVLAMEVYSATIVGLLQQEDIDELIMPVLRQSANY